VHRRQPTRIAGDVSASAPAPEPLVGGLLAELLARRGSSGGFRARADDPADLEIVDATAWAALALALVRPGTPEHVSAAAFLARAQSEDGRLSTSVLHPGAYSPTSVAVLAWTNDGEHAARRERAVDFLLGHGGLTYPHDPSGPIRVDTETPGWPWIDKTFSWAEPTALALLALVAAGRAEHARARDGVHVLLDRQLESGGWNYGNTRVYDTELRPAPESTGLVLAALAGARPPVERARVARSLSRLESDLPRLRTPQSLAWSLLGGAAWGVASVAVAREGAVAETLARAARYGGYETADLALLALASASPAGLLAALPGARRIA
jgi:hypothetical protein